MQLELLAGDYDWTEQGSHVWDENGFSTILTEPKTVEMDQEIYNEVVVHVENSRVLRGLNPDGTVPVPPPQEGLIEDVPDESN
jgi:hypothetical protein